MNSLSKFGGFSLTELLTGLALLFMLMTPMIWGLIGGAKANKNLRLYNEALSLLDEKMAVMMITPFEKIPTLNISPQLGSDGKTHFLFTPEFEPAPQDYSLLKAWSGAGDKTRKFNDFGWITLKISYPDVYGKTREFTLISTRGDSLQ